MGMLTAGCQENSSKSELHNMKTRPGGILSHKGAPMRNTLRTKIIEVCDEKIAQKGENVGLSFYAFFRNQNDDPELLMEAAEWWIRTHKLDHFEKAVKIRRMIRDME
jgi:Family of unknown function (DUF6500)